MTPYMENKKHKMLKIIKKNKSDADLLLRKLEQSFIINTSDRSVKLSTNKVWKIITEQNEDVKEKIAYLSLAKLIESDSKEYKYEILRRKVFNAIINEKNPPSKLTMQLIFSLFIKLKEFSNLPIKNLLFVYKYFSLNFENKEKDIFFSASIGHILNSFKETKYPEKEHKEFVFGIIKIIKKEKEFDFFFDKRDIVGKKIELEWKDYSVEIKNVFDLCWNEKYRSTPTKSWLKRAKSLIESAENIEGQVNIFSKYFILLDDASKSIVKRLNSINSPRMSDSLTEIENSEFINNLKEYDNNKYKYYIEKTNEDALCYLIWYCSLINNHDLNHNIGNLALSSYLKIKWRGVISKRIGSACLYAFTLMPEKVGIIHLLSIRNRTSNKNIKNIANKNIALKSKELGLTEESLIEMSTPDFGIKNNMAVEVFSGYEAIISILDINKPVLEWNNVDSNKKQKAIPKTVKENCSLKLKEIKIKLKEIKLALNTHKTRLENSYINNIEWDIKDWKEYYIKHPLLSRFNSLLIWYFDDSVTAINKGNNWVDENLKEIDINKYSNVKLWHPIYSDVKTVKSWREYFVNNKIVQPFKQAFREIYKITDAEIVTNTYSNRFAAHILYQYQFKALARIRGWDYSLQGSFSSDDRAYKIIKNTNYKIEFWIPPVEDSIDNSNIYLYLASDQTRIYQDDDLVQMSAVPDIIFTEIMRDIDLFVGVCSIGNNPDWQDSGELREYWHSYSFGNLTTNAKIRKEALIMLLPKLKIASQCKIVDNFLIVEGKLRKYKIHIGSGNILMYPDDSYLCIVANSGKKNQIFLPFDDDRTMSIIISKAFLLANDTNIKDETILSQINNK